jgi:hypothetical protein
MAVTIPKISYDGDAEENDNYIPKKRRKNPRVRKLNINKQPVPSCAKYKPSENVTENSNRRTTGCNNIADIL